MGLLRNISLQQDLKGLINQTGMCRSKMSENGTFHISQCVKESVRLIYLIVWMAPKNNPLASMVRDLQLVP